MSTTATTSLPIEQTPEQFTTAQQAMWILRLLYAPENGQPGRVVQSQQRLVCGLYITHDSLKQSCDISLPFTFTNGNSGFSIDYLDNLTTFLKNAGLLKTTTNSTELTSYRLTTEGLCVASDLFNELNQDAQATLTWT